MIKTNNTANHKHSLSYSLPDKICFSERPSGLYLIRENPLSAITLNRVWRPVLERMGKNGSVQFNKILSLVDVDPNMAEIYLNALVRKGFLETRGYSEPDTYPMTSIIIPVRNRPDEISECLTSLLKLDYPPEKREIIVVDDASDDRTPEVVSGFDVKLIRNSTRKQASYCRNLAASEAKGEILALTDSDCAVHPLWLKELLPAFSDETNGAVGGKVDSWFENTALDRYEKVSSSLYKGRRSKSSREEGGFFYLPTCNLLVKKEIFLSLGGFDETMSVGEDVDLCWRLRDKGFETEYRPAGAVFHRHRNEMKAFFTRRFQYGTSEPFLNKKHSDRVKKMFYLPSAILLWALVLVSFLSGFYWLSGICVLILFTDTHVRWMQVRKNDLTIVYRQVLFAVFRGYFVSMYYWCEFFSRYYLFAFVLLLPLSLPVSLIIFINHLLVSGCQYFQRRPALNFPAFLYYFTADQIAYQLGVWVACFRHMSFNPVNPIIARWKSQ